jgi:hypothetical protein
MVAFDHNTSFFKKHSHPTYYHKLRSTPPCPLSNSPSPTFTDVEARWNGTANKIVFLKGLRQQIWNRTLKLWVYMGAEVGTHGQPFPLCNASWLFCCLNPGSQCPAAHARTTALAPITSWDPKSGRLGKTWKKKGPGPESCKELRFKFIFQEKTRLECLEMLVEVLVTQNSQKGGPYGPWTRWTRKTCHFNWLIIRGKKHHKKTIETYFQDAIDDVSSKIPASNFLSLWRLLDMCIYAQRLGFAQALQLEGPHSQSNVVATLNSIGKINKGIRGY